MVKFLFQEGHKPYFVAFGRDNPNWEVKAYG